MFNTPRRNKHKIMKKRERKEWRRLPKQFKVYRAAQLDTEYETAISWTLSKKVAQRFMKHGDKKILLCMWVDKSEVFAYFDRRKEQEVLINI